MKAGMSPRYYWEAMTLISRVKSTLFIIKKERDTVLSSILWWLILRNSECLNFLINLNSEMENSILDRSDAKLLPELKKLMIKPAL